MANPTIQQLAADLAAGRTTSRRLTEEALERIADTAGEGSRTFIKVWRDQALATADASDTMREAGLVPTLLAGLPVSIKNLCDVAGETTLAGSKALERRPACRGRRTRRGPPARGRCGDRRQHQHERVRLLGRGLQPALRHARQSGRPQARAGRLVVGRGRVGGRLHGRCRTRHRHRRLGAHSRRGVRHRGLQADGRRVPIDGVVPLSTSLDSIGPLANSVECCAIVDAVFAGEPVAVPSPAPLAGLRLAVPMHFVMDDLEPVVAAAFERALKALSGIGVKIEHIDLPELNELNTINARGTFAASEAYAWHRTLIERRGKDYDQLVYPRIMRGKEMGAADYIELLQARADLQKRVSAITSNYDAVVMPTCAIAAPTLDEISTPDGFTRKNMLLLRNTTVGNFLDRCSISLPCHAPGELPVGFMLMGEAMADKRLLAMARSVAPVVRAN